MSNQINYFIKFRHYKKNKSDLEEIKFSGLTGSTDTYQTKSEDENYVRGGIMGGIIGFLIFNSIDGIDAIVGSIIVGVIGSAIGYQIKK